MQKFYFSRFLYLLFLVISSQFYAQIIPDDDIIPVCDSQSMTLGAPGNTGIYNLTIPCNTGLPLSPFMDFYYVRIQSGTTFTFLVEPVGNDDYDFGAWLNPNWNNINATPNANKRGSQNDPTSTGQYNLGLTLTATDLCETGGSQGYPEPGMVRYFDVQPGDEILIAIDRWSNTTNGYTISFGGDAELDCTILGNSYGKCDVDNNNSEQFVITDFLDDLEEDFPNHSFSYYSTQLAAENETGAQINFPLTVNYNNGDATEVFVRVENNAGGFVRVVKLFLYVNKLPVLLANDVDLPLQCDPDLDGQATFDLTTAQPLLVTTPADFTFKYYTTLADANAGGTNNIPAPAAYNSGTAQIFVRVSNEPLDGNEEGCFRVATINLEVSDFDVPAQNHTVDPLCDEDGNGFVNVNLNDYLVEFVTAPTDYQISFHVNMADAGTGNNPIPIPNNYAIPAGTNPIIYVRIKSLTDICFSISTLQFNTVPRPVINPLTDVEECVDQQTGDHLFDLTQFNALVVNNPNNFTITYHISQADADSGNNPIPNLNAHPLALNTTHTIYIRVEANGCANTTEVDITINSNPEVGPDAAHTDLCDADGDGDGNLIVDLTENEAVMLTNPANFLVTYHTSQADANSGANAIPTPTNYTILAGQTVVVFMRVQNLLNDCFTTRTITYSTLERPELNVLTDVEECVDQLNGNIPFDLTVFAPQIVNNPNAYTITYHTSQADADLGTNPIANPNAYPITVDVPTQIFIRVANNGCHDTGSVWISLFSKPDVNNLPPQVFCTTELTGSVNYDLTQHEMEWAAGGTGNLIFTYHTSQADADLGQNAIGNSTNYPIPVGATTLVYVRVQNQTNDCFVVTILTLSPGATATLNTDVEVALCDPNFDGIYTYNLSQLNAQLIANPAGLTFSYYLTQQNAQNGTNPIAQNQWNNYQFNALPYEIWVVAHTADDCPSIPVRVQFVYGTDITLITSVIGPVEYCIDDTINLTSLQNQMTNETQVFFSYHTNLADAENDSNPIANVTEFIPDGNNSVFVRLEKLDRCPVIVEIRFERLQTPSIELNNSYFELCPGSSFEAIATSDDPNATFAWYLSGTEIGTGSIVELTQNGTYTVVVTGANGCINETTLTIATPPTPYITGIEYGPNYVIVSANSGDGGGSLEFSLDGIFWQNNPRFDNLIPGEAYTVYVREDGCMKDSYEVTILLITNFISPNGDGKNDIWEVRGIELSPQTTIKIFDRYGKVFVDTNFEGNYRWDGKYLGRPVPSGDYWYIMNVPSDGIVKAQKFSGHISVRNQ